MLRRGAFIPGPWVLGFQAVTSHPPLCRLPSAGAQCCVMTSVYTVPMSSAYGRTRALWLQTSILPAEPHRQPFVLVTTNPPHVHEQHNHRLLPLTYVALPKARATPSDGHRLRPLTVNESGFPTYRVHYLWCFFNDRKLTVRKIKGTQGPRKMKAIVNILST